MFKDRLFLHRYIKYNHRHGRRQNKTQGRGKNEKIVQTYSAFFITIDKL